MALERFMLYVDGETADRLEVVYCWGFRASLSVAKKMAASREDGTIVLVDLDTHRESRLHRDRPTYAPASGDPPVAGFLTAAPQPLNSRTKLARRKPHLLRRERELHPRLTAWARVA